MKRSFQRSADHYAACALLCLAAIIAYVPISPNLPADTLDSGWAFGMNAAMGKGLVIGRDVVFTMGPYSSVFTALYSPATDARMLAGGALLAAGFAAGLLCLARGGAMRASLGLALFLPLTWHDAQFFTLPFVMLLLCFRAALPAGRIGRISLDGKARLALALLTAALALLPLVKATFGVASAAAMVLGCGLLALGGYGLFALLLGALYAAAIPLFWVLSPQKLAALPGYFIAQAPVVSGFTNAMGLDGRFWHIPLYLGCCVAFVFAHGRHLAAAGRAGGILLAASFLLLFLGFKEGFVRHDLHAMTAAAMLAIAGWAGLLMGRHDFASRIALAIGLSCWAVIVLPNYGPTFSIRAVRLLAPYAEAGPGVAIRLFEPRALQDSYEASLALIRTQSPLPALRGSTDVYSYGQSALLAAGLDWDPRPAMQSYAAYTPALLRADAAHLTGPAAPENIVFAVQPLDGRLPALEDGASWPLLLAGYRFVGVAGAATDILEGDGGNAVIMARRPVPFPIHFQPILTGVFRLGAKVPLPASFPMVWAEISLKPGLNGRLLSLLYKPPMLLITYGLAGGRSVSFRYIAGAGETGFLIAPVVTDSQEFAGLASTTPGSSATGLTYPSSFRLDSAYGAGWLWKDTYRLRLSRLQINPN